MKWIDTTKKSNRFMVVIVIFTVVIGLWQCLSYVPRLPTEYRVFYYNHTNSLLVDFTCECRYENCRMAIM